MGILIFIFLFVAAAASLTALAMVIASLVKRTLSWKECAAGVVLTLLLFGLLFADYKFSTSVYVLGAYFLFPFFMIFLPFIIGLAMRFSSRPGARFFSNILLVAAVASGVLILLLPQYTTGIADYLGLAKHY